MLPNSSTYLYIRGMNSFFKLLVCWLFLYYIIIGHLGTASSDMWTDPNKSKFLLAVQRESHFDDHGNSKWVSGPPLLPRIQKYQVCKGKPWATQHQSSREHRKSYADCFLDEKGVPTTYHLPCSNKVQGLCYAELLPKLRKAVSRKWEIAHSQF